MRVLELKGDTDVADQTVEWDRRRSREYRGTAWNIGGILGEEKASPRHNGWDGDEKRHIHCEAAHEER